MSKLINLLVFLLVLLFVPLAFGNSCYSCQGVNVVNQSFDNVTCESLGSGNWYSESVDCSIMNPTSNTTTLAVFMFIGVLLFFALISSILWVKVP